MTNKNSISIALNTGVDKETLKADLLGLGYEVAESDANTLELSKSPDRGIPLSIHGTTKEAKFDERLQLVADASPVCLTISRKSDGELLFANRIMADFAGRSQDQLVGELTPTFYKTPSDRLLVIETLARDGFVKEMELEFIRHDGAVRIVLASVFPIEIDGEPLLVGGGIDVTQERESQEALRQAARRQEVLLREVNHRVRNNLGALLAVLSQERSKLYKNGIREEADAWHVLERRVRALAAVQTLLSKSMWGPVHARTLCLKTAESMCAGDDPTPSVFVEGSTVELESSQAQHLSLVVSELVINSLRHSQPASGLVITMRAWKIDSNVVIIYRDNGRGYGPEILGKTQHEGPGLGAIFKIVRQYLEGQVSLESDNGAIARIQFPYAPMQQAAG